MSTLNPVSPYPTTTEVITYNTPQYRVGVKIGAGATVNVAVPSYGGAKASLYTVACDSTAIWVNADQTANAAPPANNGVNYGGQSELNPGGVRVINKGVGYISLYSPVACNVSLAFYSGGSC
jgi:hypothetical protein